MSRKKTRRMSTYFVRWMVLLIVLGMLSFLAYCGVRVWHFYRAMNGELPREIPSAEEFPVRGIDVSMYQGEIDWEKLSENEYVTFAFMKATEGENFQDDSFLNNWKSAREHGIYTGAYHFLRFDSTGEAQAENFISLVPKQANMLPPVVDLELYSEADIADPPSRADVQAVLDPMLERLEEYYGVKPIIYTSANWYMKYLIGGYWSYDIWMCNINSEPIIGWSFWQYSFEGMFPDAIGVNVDLDVYNGSKESFYRRYHLSPDFAVYRKEQIS